MSWKYHTSLLLYSIVKVCGVLVWVSLIEEEIIGSPVVKDFIEPEYAVLTIVLLLLLPIMHFTSKTTKVIVVLLLAGLLIIDLYLVITDLYLVVDSVFSLQPMEDYELNWWLVPTAQGAFTFIYCTAILSLINESLRSVRLFSQ